MGGKMKDFGSIFGQKWDKKRDKNQARKKVEQGRALFRKMGGPRGSFPSLALPLWGVLGAPRVPKWLPKVDTSC